MEGLLGHAGTSGVESGKFWVESGYSDLAVRVSFPPEFDGFLDDSGWRALGIYVVEVDGNVIPRIEPG